MSFPRYPAYKDSGVKWLGEVPEHWDVMPLKRDLDFLTSGSRGWAENYSDEGELFIRITNLTRGSIGLDLTDIQRVAVPDGAEGSRTKVRSGDVLFSITAYLGSVAVVPDALESAYVSQHVALARFHQLRLTSKWVGFVALSVVGQAWFGMKSYGGTKIQLSLDDVRDLPTPVAPVDEQRAIAAFLDRETAKIDELVAEQRRLMELLKEKRQAVISHAVMKGLNPDAPMKPSGIEWLGEVPAHWEFNRIANVFREVGEPGTAELPILSVSIHHGVSDKEIAEDELERKVTRSDDRSKYKQVSPGDLVYNMMRAWQGGFGTVTVMGMVSPAYVVARPLKMVKTAYIEHLLRTPQAIEQMRRHSRGVTDFRLRLYWDEFKNIRVALPPIEETTAICAKISELEERFSAMSAESAESIRLLQERRTALISAAVTGQIDVRALSPTKAMEATT